jgi:hypothetical protein
MLAAAIFDGVPEGKFKPQLIIDHSPGSHQSLSADRAGEPRGFATPAVARRSRAKKSRPGTTGGGWRSGMAGS